MINSVENSVADCNLFLFLNTDCSSLLVVMLKLAPIKSCRIFASDLMSSHFYFSVSLHSENSSSSATVKQNS